MRANKRCFWSSRRGASETAIDWFVALIFTVMVIFVLFAIVASFKTREVDTRDLDPYIYVSKLYHSQNILSEPRGGVLQYGRVDLNLFSSQELEKRNQYLDEFIGVAITLKDYQGVAYAPATLPLKENPIYNNYDLYRELRPFALQGVKLKGGATITEFTQPIVFELGGVLIQGYLSYEIVTPHSRGDKEATS